MRAKAALKTNARLHTGCDNRIAHPFEILIRQTNGLFNKQVLARLGSRNRLIRVKFVWRANIDNMNIGICDHIIVIFIRLQRRAVFCCKIILVVIPARTYRRDICTIDCLKRINMRPGYPAESNNADIEIAHESLRD